jgi:hypothetical protein
MKKAYSLKVGQDIVPLEVVEINNDGSAKAVGNTDKVFAYENSPTIVNLSSMTEIPSVGDTYDSSLEGFPFVRQSTKPFDSFAGHGKFAFVVDNVVKLVLALDLSNEHGSAINAALASNPEFLEPEIIE